MVDQMPQQLNLLRRKVYRNAGPRDLAVFEIGHDLSELILQDRGSGVFPARLRSTHTRARSPLGSNGLMR